MRAWWKRPERYLRPSTHFRSDTGSNCFQSARTPDTGTIEDAEDAVQDTLLSAFLHVREFDGRSRLEPGSRIAIQLGAHYRTSEEPLSEQSGRELASTHPRTERTNDASNLRTTHNASLCVRIHQCSFSIATASSLCNSSSTTSATIFHRQLSGRLDPTDFLPDPLRDR